MWAGSGLMMGDYGPQDVEKKIQKPEDSREVVPEASTMGTGTSGPSISHDRPDRPDRQGALHHNRPDRQGSVLQQPIGTLASNSVRTLLDVVEEVSAMDRITFGGVTAAVTRPDRAAYLGIVLVAIGITLVVLDKAKYDAAKKAGLYD